MRAAMLDALFVGTGIMSIQCDRRHSHSMIILHAALPWTPGLTHRMRPGIASHVSSHMY